VRGVEFGLELGLLALEQARRDRLLGDARLASLRLLRRSCSLYLLTDPDRYPPIWSVANLQGLFEFARAPVLARCCTGCYTSRMPTRHPRHSITETPPVREALDALRRRGERVRLDDLVIRGANERLREMEAEHDANARDVELRQQLIGRMRSGDGVDVKAAYEVRERGWTH
jgi:hypothetical protein